MGPFTAVRRATLQTELLDRLTWGTREQLANAVFAFIEGF